MQERVIVNLLDYIDELKRQISTQQISTPNTMQAIVERVPRQLGNDIKQAVGVTISAFGQFQEDVLDQLDRLSAKVAMLEQIIVQQSVNQQISSAAAPKGVARAKDVKIK